MTEEEIQHHVMRVESMPELEVRVALQQARAKRAMAMFGVVGGLVVLTALVVSLFTVLGRNDTSRQLKDAQKLLATFNAQDSELGLCESKYNARVSDAARENTVGETELVVLIATVQPADREPVIGNKVADLANASKAYRVAGDARSDWVDAGKPLPCPI